MIKIGNAPAKVTQWKSGNLTGTTTGTGNNSYNLDHNIGKECSYIKVSKDEGTGTEHLLNVYDLEANLSSTTTNHIWGYRWINVSVNRVQLILHRVNIRSSSSTVRATLYFFD